MALLQYDFTTIAGLLRNGGVGVIRTDTIYGIVASAHDETAVRRVFTIKQRTPTKPPISLISNFHHLYDEYDPQTIALLEQYWPGKNTFILPSTNGPAWLTRGTGTVSYRLPDVLELRSLIDQTGPLIAPSANPEGAKPAATIKEAQAYFKEAVDFYVDGGQVTDSTPSRIYRLMADGVERVR